MVNKVILVGNVGFDPEVRTMQNGNKVARIRMATTERFYNSQTRETTEHTEWHSVTLWRGLADVADRYVRKGSQLYIEGRLRTREYVDKENIKRYATEIQADDMKLLGRRAEGTGTPVGGGNLGGGNTTVTPAAPTAQPSAPSNQQMPQEPFIAGDETDDLPF